MYVVILVDKKHNTVDSYCELQKSNFMGNDMNNYTQCIYTYVILCIAFCLCWKSFDGQGTSNSLKNFCGSHRDFRHVSSFTGEQH